MYQISTLVYDYSLIIITIMDPDYPSRKLTCLLKKGTILHNGELTWNLKITKLQRKAIFQTSIIVFQPLIS